MLPERAQDEIFGADPDARVCGILVPGPQPVTPVEGGLEISGRWGFASGCLHATWAMLPGPVVEDGQIVDLRLVFVPIEELAIEDTWDVMGLRGTGSNTLVADRVFVPEHRTFGLLGPDGALEGTIRNEHRDESIYWAPLGMAAGACLSGAFVGMARAARDHALAKLSGRPISYTVHPDSAQVVATQVAVADACTRLDLATMLAHRVADDCTAAGSHGGPPDSVVLRTRARNDAAYLAQMCREIVASFVQIAGASSVARGDFMEQVYRDVTTGALHGVLQAPHTLELHGAALCGRPPTNSYLF